MNLSYYIGPKQILLHIKAKDKWDLLDQMIEALLQGDICQEQSADVRALIGPTILKRERQSSTGLGEGYAFPHGRVPGFSGLAVCFGILDEPIKYGGPTDDPNVQIVCMVITPEEDPVVAVRVMGAFSMLLGDEAVKHYFLNESSSENIYNYLLKKQLHLEATIVARDIMRPPCTEVHLETPLRKVVHTMLLNNTEAVSVTDKEGHVLGQITSNGLFKQGLPDFFSQLTSVSFIKYFDPFETYFVTEAGSKAGDIMTDDFSVVNEDATLMEIVFRLAIQNYPKLYILRNGIQVGIIDRAAVLDRILNL
jgi:PTS system nitrogen regulatory IIA component